MSEEKKHEQIQKELRLLKIEQDLKVNIKFEELVFEAPAEGSEESDDVKRVFSVKSAHKPHKDMLDTLKKLRKFALQACEIDYDPKKLSSYMITAVKISGSFFKRQTRVVMTVTKKIEWYDGTTSFDTPEITMYGESTFQDVEKMTAIIEDLIEESWSYLNGKYESEGQLPLFDRAIDKVLPKLQLSFTQ